MGNDVKQDIILDKPTEDLMSDYIAKFEKDERYKYGDSAIIKLFEKFPNTRSCIELSNS